MPAETTINLEPMPGKIIVEPQSEEREVNGILLVRTRETPSSIGTVVAVYNDFHDPDEDVDVAAFIKLYDVVIFGAHSGVTLTINRKKYVVLSEREILCRVLPEAEDEVTDVEAV